MYYVYILRSVTSGKLYTGQTDNLERRISAHNKGLSRYTSQRGPWKLIYSEEFRTRTEALIKEKFLKTGKGRDFIKSLDL
jgi:putative endonuclease